MDDTVQKCAGKKDVETCDLQSCDQLAAIFRALGHPARLAIIKRLAARSEACCGEIVDQLPLAQSTVSQHLQVLKEAGILSCSTRGRNCHYCLDWTMLQHAQSLSGDFWEGLQTSGPAENIQENRDFGPNK